MSSMRAFDTHQQVKEFKALGFKESQAEGIVKAILHSRDYDFNLIATKEQISSLEKKLDAKIEATKEQISSLEKRLDSFVTHDQFIAGLHDIKASMHELQVSIMKWTIGSMVAMSALLVAAIKVLG
jgi:hypothetical protein